MKWYHWVLIPFAVAVAVIAYVLGRRDKDLVGTVVTEIDAFEAKAEAKRILIEHDADHARAWAEARYHDKLARLDVDGKAEAGRLRDDPVALTEWLARIGR